MLENVKIGIAPAIISKYLETDYWGTIEKTAELGIRGIEMGYQPTIGNLSLSQIRDKFASYQMEVINTFCRIEDIKQNPDRIIENARSLGTSHIGIAWSYCDSAEWFRKELPVINEFGKRVKAEGFQFTYHNHDHEFKNSFDGKRAIDLFFDGTDAEYVQAEVDVAWVKVGGDDPAEFLLNKKGRCPLVHMKDVLSTESKPQFVELGTGIVDFPSIIKSVEIIQPKWLILEQDSEYKLPGPESLKTSYNNLMKLLKR